jgi:hypothetical protein
MAIHDEQLDKLLRQYRVACPETEASANFMPAVWARIDARKKSERWLVRWVNSFATAAALIVMGLGFLLYQNPQPIPQRAYIEKLTDEISEDHFLEVSYVATAKSSRSWRDR